MASPRKLPCETSFLRVFLSDQGTGLSSGPPKQGQSSPKQGRQGFLGALITRNLAGLSFFSPL